VSATAVTAHIKAMFFTYLFQAYAAWFFASAMLIWLGSVLYRTTRNTLNAYAGHTAEVQEPLPLPVLIPPRPTRQPRAHLTTAA
jgi:hypothetical protein